MKLGDHDGPGRECFLVRFWGFSSYVSPDFFLISCHLKYQNNVKSFICKVIQLLNTGNTRVKTLYFNFATIIDSMNEGNITEVPVKVDHLRQIVVK